MNFNDLRQWRFPREFRIQRPELTLNAPVVLDDGRDSELASVEQGLGVKQQCKLVAEVATELWRLQTKMTDERGEPKEEARRTYRHVAAALDVLSEAGVEVQNHTGQAYRTGLAVQAIAFQQTPEVAKETVIETIRPSIYLNEKQIQQGQVIVATPQDKE